MAARNLAGDGTDMARKAIAGAVLFLAHVPAARLAWMAREMPHFGHLHDDSIYFVAAKSMTEGRRGFGSSAAREPAQWSVFELWGRQRSWWPLSDGGLGGVSLHGKRSSCQRATERCQPSARRRFQPVSGGLREPRLNQIGEQVHGGANAVAGWMFWASHHTTGARDIVSLYTPTISDTRSTTSAG